MGRPRKPTNVALLHGDQKKNPQRVNTREPIPSARDVQPPDWLTPAAVGVWRDLADDLEHKGALTAWDVETFAILCDQVVHYRDAAAIVARSSVLIGGRTRNELVKNPAMQVMRDCAAMITSLGSRFGLTPADRARLNLVDPDDDTGDRDPARLLS